MNKGDMAELMTVIFDECQGTRESGQKEYAHDTSNAFRNFETLAKELNLDRKKVLWIYFKKHLDGILAHINGYESQREHVFGRIKDVIVYATLLAGMFGEDEFGEDWCPQYFNLNEHDKANLKRKMNMTDIEGIQTQGM